MNLLDGNETAAYCDNGIWGNKAIKEAGVFGNAVVAASSADKLHTYIPKDLVIPANAKYLHITTNNTVEGTQWHSYPETSVPLIGDMSSDIFSRPANFKQFSLIYAGAQKNMGAAGVNMVVIKKDLLGKIQRKIPTIMNYQKHIEAGSLMNTPPVFAVYVSMLTLQWIEQQGGLAEMEKRTNQRASLLYDTLDNLPFYSTRVVKEDRSQMNAVFFIENEELQNKFLDACKEAGFIGVKGYRTVGGIRVSMYNALSLSSVEAITNMMQAFAKENG
jgi:phosphoserine aminotransferase